MTYCLFSLMITEVGDFKTCSSSAMIAGVLFPIQDHVQRFSFFKVGVDLLFTYHEVRGIPQFNIKIKSPYMEI